MTNKMLDNKKVLAVIPARGGSKGIPKKNMQKINGNSLVGLAIKCANQVESVDRVIVSTDCTEIGKEAEAYGGSFPFIRPKSLASDEAGDIGVINHALRSMETIDRCQYDIVVMLQPTSPIRSARQVNNVILYLQEHGYDSVWTVSPTDEKYHPFKQIVVEAGRLRYIMKEGEQMLPRQRLQQTYHVNGVAYALTRECVLEQKTRLGTFTGAYTIPTATVNIDTFEDLEKACRMLASTVKET